MEPNLLNTATAGTGTLGSTLNQRVSLLSFRISRVENGYIVRQDSQYDYIGSPEQSTWVFESLVEAQDFINRKFNGTA